MLLDNKITHLFEEHLILLALHFCHLSDTGIVVYFDEKHKNEISKHKP